MTFTEDLEEIFNKDPKISNVNFKCVTKDDKHYISNYMDWYLLIPIKSKKDFGLDKYE